MDRVQRGGPWTWGPCFVYVPDGHDPSLRTPTRLAGSLLARELENKRIARVMSLQRVRKVGGSSRSDSQNEKKKEANA